MELLEIIGLEAAPLEQGDRQRIAERDHQGRRRRRRIGLGAGFRGVRNDQLDVAGRAQRAVTLCGHRDQRNAEPARIMNDVRQLRGFT